MTDPKTTKACPHCGNDAENNIILGDADPALERLLECGCGATFTERAEQDGSAAAYYHPRLRINLFRSATHGRFVSVPGAPLRP